LKAWAEHRHPNKTALWIADKYWHTVGERNWAFGAKQGEQILLLAEHKKTPIVRHVKVKGNSSPFNGDWAYWSALLGTQERNTDKSRQTHEGTSWDMSTLQVIYSLSRLG
jgi:RNA-directed DNA polymerase